MPNLWEKNPKQRDCIEALADHQFVLYGGAAGGGKSFFLRWWAVTYLMELNACGIKGAPVGLFCEDYPSLHDRQISKIQIEFPPDLGELSRGTTRDFILRKEYGGGRILLRNLDDPSKYLSAEFAGIAVDELSRNKREVFDFLRMRMRWPGVDRPRFLGATNPGGKGHAWVKSLWIDRKFPPELEPLAHEFAFVQAKASDNPFLAKSYYENLKTLPAPMARAYAEGDWSIFAGQYFDLWESDWKRRQVVRAESLGLQPWWPRWISMDWGFADNFAVHWHARTEDGRVVTYREWVGNRLAPTGLAEGIIQRSKGEQIEDFYLGKDAFHKRTSEDSIADQIGSVLAPAGLPRPTMADDDRKGGWMLMYQLLQSGHWIIADNCTVLTDSLPMLVRDEVDVEDVAESDVDHAPDSARYGLKSRLSPKRPPLEERVKRAVGEPVKQADGTVDYTGYALRVRQAVAKEKKSGRTVVPRRGMWRKH